MAEQLLGSTVPRVWTPPLRELTPDASLGHSVIEFARDVLAVQLLPWQEWLLTHALEVRPDGLPRFRTVIALAARQNGKSLLMIVLALWRVYVKGGVVVGTAQDLANSEKAWGEAVELAEGTPELASEVLHVDKTNGKKSLRLHSGAQYRIAAASRRGARGFTADLILLDELREHQSFDSWAAVTKTTMARPDAQVWCLSNAGDHLSVVLAHLRNIAHRQLDWPDGKPDHVEDQAPDDEAEDDSVGIFEWSAPPGCDPKDRHAWAQANPALGVTITERAIASAYATDPAPVFAAEVLCQWPLTVTPGPFPPGSWDSTRDDNSTIATDSPRVVGLDMAWNRSTVTLALAGRRDDGMAHVEITAQRAGSDWVAPWLAERREKIAAVIVQANGAPASSLVADLEAAGLPVIAWRGPDLGKATGAFHDLLATGKIRHLSHPGLDQAAATAAVRPAGDAWLIDRKHSPVDPAPLVAAIAATWGLANLPAAEPVSAYEDSGLTVL
ncbi:Terminase [Segniliparus rotundus DSM 44985]|uniref:Terminase n=1 Tax=Segniliparus rotundus (strain ATCC BAA-972 / CDC 1076 / CIP 108378 / DSM 44985 / JCM 13578) TaxID=640132 RepID=D6ZFB5_SEGRD|nr:terminase family protein [Segniliparus rotundus]ADG97639.1 Terminase [Segniliparus rotundus DSM 44985]